MALSGDEDKEMRISGGGLTYDPNENFDHHHHHHHHIPPPDQALGAAAAAVVMNSGGSNKSRSPIMGSSPRIPSVRYRECLKNHAASIGGNVTDGCGEFMPTGEEGSLEALKCAACNCHRNFHRKEPVNSGGVGGVGGGGGGGGAIIIHPLQHPPPPPPQIPSLNHHHHSHHHHRVGEPVPIHSSSNHHWSAAAAAGMVQPVKMAFGGGGGGGSASGGTDSSSDQELNFYTYQSTSVQPPPQYVLAKKRFRTKFTPEQKEKMMAFAEKLGWRIPREDDTEVQRFCAENGVKRQVFKVWMHNNKNSGKKNPDEQS